MIVERPKQHQEGTIKFKLYSGGETLKMMLYTEPHTIVPKINVFHGDIPTEIYDGEYTVKPMPYESQELETRDKLLQDNVVVLAIPYFETSNISDGLTVYIGE